MYWHLVWETNPYYLIVLVIDLILTEKTLKSVGELYLGIHVLSFGIIYTSLKFMGILYNYKVPTFAGFLQRLLVFFLRRIRGKKKQTILSIKGEKMRKKSTDINVEIKESIKELLSNFHYSRIRKYISKLFNSLTEGCKFAFTPIASMYSVGLEKISAVKKQRLINWSTKNEKMWMQYNQLLLDIQELKREKLLVAQEINELAVLQRMSIAEREEPVNGMPFLEKESIGRLSMMEDHRLSMISNLEERLSIYQESMLDEDIEAYNQEIAMTQKELEMEISLLDFDELNERLLQLRSINMQLKNTLDGEITFTEVLRKEIDQLK
ncbi:hypothetical protein HDV06_005447 [Boothiomyces sp. JEL0866]|nr:hypothetical protein HDV06_005447 [Boothiomyces sp. JEL0866]